MNPKDWYIKKNAGIQGPFTRVQMIEMAQAGVVRPETEVGNGNNQWQRAYKFTFLLHEMTASYRLPAGWYYITDSGIQGPFTPKELSEKAREDVIRPSTLVRYSEKREWQNADTLPFLRQLRPSVERILRRSVETGVVADAPDATAIALMEKGLCDTQKRLTEEGKVVAISLCTLPVQCEVLGLPLQVSCLPKAEKPELAVMAGLNKGDCKVAYCEGGAVSLLLYCLCFDRLYPLYKAWAASYGSSDPGQSAQKAMYAIRFGRQGGGTQPPEPKLIEMYPDLPSQMVADIGNGSEGALLRSFDTLLSWQRQPPGYSAAIAAGCWRLYNNWIGVNRELILALFRALGAARWAAIAEGLLADGPPFGKGWPDLIWVQGTKVGLIEVKTTDRLILSQIVAFPKISQVLRLPVEVVQVEWEKGRK